MTILVILNHILFFLSSMNDSSEFENAYPNRVILFKRDKNATRLETPFKWTKKSH